MDESRIWLLIAKKISDEATQQELVELDILLKADPGLQYAFSIIDEMKSTSAKKYGLTEEEENNLVEKKLSEIDMIVEAEKKMELEKRQMIRWRKVKWAAACFLVLVTFSAVYLFYKGKNQRPSIAQTINRNEGVFVAETPTSITLQDGTQVWLNTGSTLKCAKDFDIKDRRVVLSGEGYFDVKHDADKPFIVQADSFMQVQVLGTAFNVKAYPHDPYIEASLISGKIAVKMKGDKGTRVILKPHEKVTFYINDSAVYETTPGDQGTNQVNYHINTLIPNPVDQHISELSWMRGELAFNDIPFIELAYDLERIYHLNITFKDDRLKEYHLTGAFKGESLDEVLQALQVTTPFQYHISDKEVVIYR